MPIFTLLGMVSDNMASLEVNRLRTSSERVIITIDDKQEIDRFVLPIIDDECVIGNYCMARLIFKKNPQNRRGELRVIVFVDSDGNETPVEVGSQILAYVSSEQKDELYFVHCDDIMF